ncbi:MAG: T9SS type A sorting domain-containing protein [Sphingobacteriales bacterium]|nr:MAG: T9SS type A sorting domain-containing protein [Sphingobacteriales bacterium]
MKISRLFSLLSVSLLSTTAIFAQDRPIGYWRAHLPYNQAICVASDGVTAFVATPESFYTNNMASKELTPYSKVEGMSDVGMSYLGYDATTQTTVLAYSNSNIDLFKDGSFFNLPELKLKPVTGSKTINHIYTNDGLAYLSTDAGILVLNLEKKEVKETYTFSIDNQLVAIKSITIAGNDIYAATPSGIFRANKNSISLQDFSTWAKIGQARDYRSIASSSGKVFAMGPDTLYAIENDVPIAIYISGNNNRHIDEGKDGIWLSENYDDFTGKVKKFDLNNHPVDSVKVAGHPAQLVDIGDQARTILIADEFRGLTIRQDFAGEGYALARPQGPSNSSTFDIYANNKEVWVAHGSYTEKWIFNHRPFGFSSFASEKWTQFKLYEYPPFGDTMFDFIRIIKGPDNNVYAASYGGGVFVLKADGTTETYKQNSILDDSYTAPGNYLATGLAFDAAGNLWVTMFGGDHELAVRTKEGNWYEFAVPPLRPILHAASDIIIDDNDLKWYIAPLGGGVMVYDDGGTIDNPNDDKYRNLLAGKGNGGLPDATVYSIAKDKTGSIWVGTNNGIGIISCPSQVIANECEAEIRVVQYDDFAGYLFANEQVRAIAVDGGNRKWIGTLNGLWLLSPDGDKIISRFTAENSPLLSNHIEKITIDPVTGDVYVGTDKGMMSYRGTATDGGSKNNDELVSYPNPVSSGYKGTIAIKGLVENADVRITDISGQLVYRTTALGGQAVWNGMDYTGKRPQSGVYLIFATNKDGSQTRTGKLVFME